MPPTETQIFKVEEVHQVLRYLKQTYARRKHASAFTNIAIFRLLLLGLRSCEVSGLEIRDLIGGPDPTLTIREEITKHDKYGRAEPRELALKAWDAYAMVDLLAFRNFRIKRQAPTRRTPLVCRQTKEGFGQRLRPTGINARFMRFVKHVLGPERAAQLRGSHAGRRSFITMAQRAGHQPIEVMVAVGHVSLKTLTGYTVPFVRQGLPPVWGDPAARLVANGNYDTVS